MRHPDGRYDVVNSGCAKGKSLLTDRELAALPSVTEFDHHDDHKTIFFMQAMVHGLRNRKFGGRAAFEQVWAQRVHEAEQRLAQRKERGLTKKKLIPVVYRDNVGSTPQKTKGQRKTKWMDCACAPPSAAVGHASALTSFVHPICFPTISRSRLLPLRPPQPRNALRQECAATVRICGVRRRLHARVGSAVPARDRCLTCHPSPRICMPIACVRLSAQPLSGGLARVNTHPASL
jgi:hypothetical protein